MAPEESIEPTRSPDQYVSLHDLARDCDVRQKRVWWRFQRLKQSGELVPGDDFYTAAFVDSNHFEWRINGTRYLELSPKHAAKFEAKRLQKVDPEVEDELTPDPPAVESKETPVELEEPHEKEEIEERPPTSKNREKSSDLLLDVVVDQIAKKDEQLEEKDELLREQQETIRVMGVGYQTILGVNQTLALENKKLSERLFQLPPGEEKDGGEIDGDGTSSEDTETEEID